jgi:hypothetical protein
MIKASEGGGGKGIRRVEQADQFPALFQQVQGAPRPLLVSRETTSFTDWVPFTTPPPPWPTQPRCPGRPSL